MTWARGHGLPGGRRSAVIVVLLLASLVLVGILGWQAWRLQQSNEAVADSVLREYAILVVDEFGRRATTALGYRAYYPLITAIADLDSLSAMHAALDAGPAAGVPACLATGLFIVTEGETQTDIGEPSPAVRT